MADWRHTGSRGERDVHRVLVSAIAWMLWRHRHSGGAGVEPQRIPLTPEPLAARQPESAQLAPGMHWLRLRQGNYAANARVVLTR